MPALYRSADKASIDGRRTYQRLRGWQLVLLFIAAIAGALTWPFAGIDWAGAIALLAFLAAGGCQYRLVSERPERPWYDGRAAAESIKALAWRYAMRAEPFDDHTEADQAFVARLGQISESLRHLALPTAGEEQITGPMGALRSSDLEGRRVAYVEGRVQDQQRWYSTKADASRTLARHWRVAVNIAVAVGVLAGLAKTFGVLDVDVLGVAATGIGAATAWVQVQQHEILAVAYGVTAQELALVKELAAQPTDEASWSEFVNDAEQAISREHQLWRASRTAIGPEGSRAGI